MGLWEDFEDDTRPEHPRKSNTDENRQKESDKNSRRNSFWHKVKTESRNLNIIITNVSPIFWLVPNNKVCEVFKMGGYLRDVFIVVTKFLMRPGISSSIISVAVTSIGHSEDSSNLILFYHNIIQ